MNDSKKNGGTKGTPSIERAGFVGSITPNIAGTVGSLLKASVLTIAANKLRFGHLDVGYRKSVSR